MYSYDQVDAATRARSRRELQHALAKARTSKRLLKDLGQEAWDKFADDDDAGIEDKATELLSLANRAVDVAAQIIGTRMELADLGYLEGLRKADAEVEREIHAEEQSFEGHLRRERAQEMREDGEDE